MYSDWSWSGEDIAEQGAEPVDHIQENVDAMFERMLILAGETRRRMGGVPPKPPVLRRGRANDGRHDTPPRIDLVLYTSAASEKSQRATRAVQEVLKRYDASQVKFALCDLSVAPQEGETDAVVFTPTLVKQGPGPRTSIIGNLESEEILCDLLDASGVDRLRWDD